MTKYLDAKWLWLLWVAATVAWLAIVFVARGNDLFQWVGYHLSNVHSVGDFKSRLAKKYTYQAVKDSCVATEQAICDYSRRGPLRADENEYDRLFRLERECLASPEFLSRFKTEAQARSVPNAERFASGEACGDFKHMDLPYVRWPALLLTLAVPLLPILGVLGYRFARKAAPRPR